MLWQLVVISDFKASSEEGGGSCSDKGSGARSNVDARWWTEVEHRLLSPFMCLVARCRLADPATSHGGPSQCCV